MRTRTEKVVEAGDGTLLHARETRGPRARGVPLICCNGIGVSTIFWHFLEDRFSPERPVIVWDYRGHGESEHPRDLEDLSIESCAADLLAVLDAFGHERAVLLGHSMGCQVIYEVARRRPARVLGLVPMLGTFGRPVHTFLDLETGSLVSFALGRRIGLALPELVSAGKRALFCAPRARRFVSWFARASGLVQASMPQADLEAYLDHLAKQSPVVFLKLAERMATHSVGAHLDDLDVPCLVVAGERDVFTPLWLSEEIVARLPRGRLFVLREGSHAALVEQPDAVHEAVAGFLAEHDFDAAAGAAAEALGAAAPAVARAG